MAIRASRNLNESDLAAIKLAIGSIYVAADTLVPYIGTGLSSLPKSLLTGVQLSRPSGAQVNLLNITDNGSSSAGVMTGGANQKTYVETISVNRPVGSAATGDSNDALIKGSYNNYAANDSNFIIRGVNMTVFNRSGGVAGNITCASFTADVRSGSQTTTIMGLAAMADVGDCLAGSTIYAADFVNRRQAATTPTEEGGIRIRNLAAGNMCINAAIRVHGEDNSIAGYKRLIDARGAKTLSNIASSKVTLIAFTDTGGTDRFLRVDASGAMTVETSEA